MINLKLTIGFILNVLNSVTCEIKWQV